jgi:hypothetical protein
LHTSHLAAPLIAQLIQLEEHTILQPNSDDSKISAKAPSSVANDDNPGLHAVATLVDVDRIK